MEEEFIGLSLVDPCVFLLIIFFSIEYTCPDKMFYFDYPVGDKFISYYYTVNINAINVTCNKDR